MPTRRMKNKEPNSIIKPKSTQIHHNHLEPSTQSSCPNSSNLRENPNSQIQHKPIAQHHHIHYKPQRKPSPINLSQNHQQTQLTKERPNTNKPINPNQQQTHHNQRIQTNPQLPPLGVHSTTSANQPLIYVSQHPLARLQNFPIVFSTSRTYGLHDQNPLDQRVDLLAVGRGWV